MLKQNLDFNENYTLKDPDHDEIKDGYQLRWVGKNYAKLQENLKPETVIVPDSEHNLLSENIDSQNLFLTGDNLEVLKHLEYAYTGKIDMIYIDPPYNTGSDGFVYNDDFRFTDEQLRDTLGLTEEEVKRIKNIYGKASHSAWLTFMYPRLKIAKKLLKDSGVIFVSIDDNEQANLKLLMDEVLNEGNYINKIVWKKNSSGKTVTEKYPVNIDYLYLYSKTNNYKLNSIFKPLSESTKKMYSKDDNDGRGKYRLYPLQKTGGPGPETTYDYVDNNGKIWSCPLKGWRINKNKLKDLENDNRLVLDGNSLNEKAYWNERENDGQIADTLWDDLAENNVGTAEVDKLLGKGVFTNPKPTELIQRCIQTVPEKNITIFDFFSGSGSTAHAVMKLNKEGTGTRKYIMCTLDEKVKEGSEAEKAGYKTIDEIGRERIKRAAKQIGDTSGFRHFRFIKPKLTTLDKIEKFDPTIPLLLPEDMVAPFSEQDLTGKGDKSGTPTILTTWLIDDGYDFSINVEPLDLSGYTAYYAKSIARLYLIEKSGWSAESCKALLNKLGKNEIAVNAVVIYPYSFNFVDLTELKNNIKAILDGKPEVLERY